MVFKQKKSFSFSAKIDFLVKISQKMLIFEQYNDSLSTKMAISGQNL